MSETRRLLEAASAFSLLLSSSQIPHAFHGSFLTAVLAKSPQSDEIYCIVEGGTYHPFRRVRDAVAGSENFTTTHSPWTNRLHATYRQVTPVIEIEILPAGEGGPRHLDASTVTRMHGIPFLTISEFIRAKLKTWMIGGGERDAQDIMFALSHYWNRVDINRIPEQDMNHFVARHSTAAPAWAAVRSKYNM